jgi:2,4-dienoyl-CoA reductase-like NADH-dependent reductase (Old Yellow Enzyme family)
MATAKANDDGTVTQALLDYYNEKTSGGYISLVIIEHSYVSWEGKASTNQLSAADDNVIEGLKKLSDVILNNGCKTVMQINHAGSTSEERITGAKPVGPSAVPNPRKGTIPLELDKNAIRKIIADFKSAAMRVKAAGFDGVEIHSAHGYLLNQFFSPLNNKRSDEYGGSVINRIRLHKEIIEAVSDATGPDFPVLLRLGANDFIDGGATTEDSIIAAREFERSGIDILDISGGLYGYIIPGVSGQGYFSDITQAIKKEVSIPVILTGGITEAGAAEELLSQQKADLVGVGRAILNDSNWPKQALEAIAKQAK